MGEALKHIRDVPIAVPGPVIENVFSERTHPPFPFLLLPVEIQLQILKELLSSAYNIRIVERRRPSSPLEWMIGAFYERKLDDSEVTPLQAYNRRETAASRVFPAILQTCKHLKQLGEPILYSQNTFSFVVATDSRMYFDDFCESIGRDNASLIRKIQFVIWIYGPERGSGIDKQVPHVPSGFPGCQEVAFLMWEIALMPLSKERSMKELSKAGHDLEGEGWECISDLVSFSMVTFWRVDG